MNILKKQSEKLKTFKKSVENFPLTIVYSLLWALAALGQSAGRTRPFDFFSLGLGRIEGYILIKTTDF